MIVCKTKTELSEQIQRLKRNSQRIGFVPTMGALHEGHLSLVERASEAADITIVSIFVNPTQFAPHEDFNSYPREIEGDLRKLERAGAGLVYLPQVSDLYPDGPCPSVKAGKMAEGLEGHFRPGHYDGVVTVVRHLFTQVQPDIAIFGEKDYQQLQVIREMVADQGLAIEIIGGAIIRDEHGLALSSRNAYLSDEELEIARMLNQVTYKAAHDIGTGIAEEDALREAKDMIIACGFDKVDYVSAWQGRVLVAAWLGNTRLIDNAPICDTAAA